MNQSALDFNSEVYTLVFFPHREYFKPKTKKRKGKHLPYTAQQGSKSMTYKNPLMRINENNLTKSNIDYERNILLDGNIFKILHDFFLSDK